MSQVTVMNSHNCVLHNRVVINSTEYDTVNAYIPQKHKGDKESFRAKVEEKVIDVITFIQEFKDRNIIVMGDFNNSQRVKECMEKLGICNVVANSTHREGGKLDLIFTNCRAVYTPHQVPGPGNDHDVISVKLQAKYECNEILGKTLRRVPLSKKEAREVINKPETLCAWLKGVLAWDLSEALPTLAELMPADTFTKVEQPQYCFSDGSATYLDQNSINDHKYYVNSTMKECESKAYMLNQHFKDKDWGALARQCERIAQIKAEETIAKGIKLEDGRVVVGYEMEKEVK